MRIRRLLALPLALLTGAVLSSETVLTTSGPVKGHVSTVRPGVQEYLGIPYARPPKGELRFMPPVRYEGEDEIDASRWAPDCPHTPGKPIDFPHETPIMKEIVANFGGQKGYPQSEDCLKLNIWTKANTDNTTKPKPKPVLVWIHGGRFTIGSAHNLFYQGQYLADEEDIVVVTVQYRTNIFGFPGAPNHPPNLGLMDQRLAMGWVRDNIASFNGDPSRITISGQSAGGVAVDYFTYAYHSDPIVAGVIPMSGTALSMRPNSRELSEGYWIRAAKEAGCEGSDGAVMQCMREKSTEELLAAVKKVPFAPSKALNQPVFHPTVDNEIVFNDYEALSEQGEFIKVPYLVGNTAKESGFYAIAALTSNITMTPHQWTLFNGAGFTCPSSRAASHRAAHDVPVWRYAYHGQWPNSIMYEAPGTGDGGSGPYHGSDVAQVFGTAEDVSGGVKNTEMEGEVGRGMRAVWGAFVRDPVGGIGREMGWRKYGETKKVVAFGYENQGGPVFLDSEVVDGVCEVVGTDTSFAQGAF